MGRKSADINNFYAVSAYAEQGVVCRILALNKENPLVQFHLCEVILSKS